MTRIAANRLLPPDEVLIADLRAGLNYTEIARRHGVFPQSVGRHIRKMGWVNPGNSGAAALGGPSESQSKVVVTRQVMVDGRYFRTAEVNISLPRIPTLHGHFQGA